MTCFRQVVEIAKGDELSLSKAAERIKNLFLFPEGEAANGIVYEAELESCLKELSRSNDFRHNAIVLLYCLYIKDIEYKNDQSFSETIDKIFAVLTDNYEYVLKMIRNNPKSTLKMILDRNISLCKVNAKDAKMQMAYSSFECDISDMLTETGVKEGFFKGRVYQCNDKKIDNSISLYAVYIFVYLTTLRRNKEMGRFKKEFEIYWEEEELHICPIIKTFYIYSNYRMGSLNGSWNALEEFKTLLDITFANDIWTSGNYCTLATAVYDYISYKDCVLDDIEFKSYYDFALDCIGKAIIINKNYAKYYMVQSELKKLHYEITGDEGSCSDAINSIKKAISLQRNDSSENRTRKMEYNVLKSEMELKYIAGKTEKQQEKLEKLLKQTSEQQEELKEIKKNNIKTLTLFLSIGAFLLKIMAGSNNIEGLTFIKYASLLIVMLGISVSIYAVMDMFVIDALFPSTEKQQISKKFKDIWIKNNKKVILIIIGICLIVVGIILGYFAP